MFVEISILMFVAQHGLGYIRFTCIAGQIEESKFILISPAILC